MIKLTRFKGPEDTYEGVRHHFIPVDKIVAVNEGSGNYEGRSCLWLGAHDSIVVQESAEEVLRMIEEALKPKPLGDIYSTTYFGTTGPITSPSPE